MPIMEKLSYKVLVLRTYVTPRPSWTSSDGSLTKFTTGNQNPNVLRNFANFSGVRETASSVHQKLVLIMIRRSWILLAKLSLGRTCETPAESLLSLHFAILPFYIWRRRAASKTLGRPQICELGPETTRWLQYCYELLRARITRLNTGPGHWSREHQ